jgi:DNA polymerase III subunit delta'
MPDPSDLEADRFGSALHPRFQKSLFGQEAAEGALLQAFASGKPHHAWILGGAQGIGKATLAWRMARFLVEHPDAERVAKSGHPVLEIDPEDRSVRLLLSLAHPNVFLLRRGLTEDGKRLATEIRVGQVRKMLEHFHATSGDGGWRIGILDSTEDLNSSSANTLLKLLEEPPARCIFFLISHAPGRILPTLRSRCRMLMLEPLEQDTVLRILQTMPDGRTTSPERLQHAAERAEGSMCRALTLLDDESLRTTQTIETLLEALPHLDLSAVLVLAEEMTKREGEEKFTLLLDLTSGYVSRCLHIYAAKNHSPRHLSHLAETFRNLQNQANEAERYNLDRRPVVLSLFTELAASTKAFC